MNTWQENILGKLDEREARQGPPRKSAHVTYPLEHHAFLRAAADARGMRLGTYFRNAVYAFAAYDLGVDMDELLGRLPDYGKDVGAADGRKDAKPTSGQWSIEKLGGKTHGADD